MLKAVDVGLMSNHLFAHKAIIKRLEYYAMNAKSPQLITNLHQQIQTMKNHVNVMNQLLDPKQVKQITVPPIPMNLNIQASNTGTNFDIEDKDITIDAHFTATAMAKENFTSSENMKTPSVKKVHSQMALQQSTIAEKHAVFAEQMGWMKAPGITVNEQTATISPIEMMSNPAMTNNQVPNQIENHIN